MDQTRAAVLIVPKQDIKRRPRERRERGSEREIPYYCYQSKASSSSAALMGPLSLSLLIHPGGIWTWPAYPPLSWNTHTRGPVLVHVVSFVKLVHSLWPCLFIRRGGAYFSPFPALVLLIGGYTLPNTDILWSSQIITFTSLIYSMWFFFSPPQKKILRVHAKLD